MMGHVLYHYTDYFALDGILNHAELRVNNVLNMNDAEEMRFFMKKVGEAVKKGLEELGRQEDAKQIVSWFQDELQNDFFYSSYAACFSRYRDDASQWERYGNNGRGVSIGFDRDVLERMTGGAIRLKEVFYQSDFTHHELVNQILSLFHGNERISKEELREPINEAWAMSVAFKHPSFACEKEVRLVVSPFDQEYFDVSPKYHISAERIKKYYPIDLNHLCEKAGCALEDLIVEIIIGPESTQSLPILQDYFRDTDHGALAERIALSECPLRGVRR